MYNRTEFLKEEDFINPSSCYRGAPFWAWNSSIRKETLKKQIGYMKDMGMGGFIIHSRTGLETEYLGEEFLEDVAYCNDLAKDMGLLCWLYDEDRYSSGYGGGYVTKDIRFRERYLIFSPVKLEGFMSDREAFRKAVAFEPVDAGILDPEPKGYFIETYSVSLEKGCLRTWKRHGGEEEEGLWYAYLKVGDKTSWYNNETYVDTLNKEAIDKFISVAYEKYREAFGKDFGGSIPAIFTDEPMFPQKTHLGNGEERLEVILPFTDDFPETFERAYGYNLLDHLPELVWNMPEGKISQARYHYHNHITDRFVEAYAGNIGSWCDRQGIALTGHLKGEENLRTQTAHVGEVMRSLRHFQIPGIDVLCDQRDYSMAKMAQSVANQYDRIGAMSELAGVTNWDFDFKGHKLMGDWQAALGITVRVPHLAWMSMKGEAKRDYPASIHYQSPWYGEYRYIEDHFARINAVMTKGKPLVHIGVIHPVESYWLYFGPNEQNSFMQGCLEQNYRNIVNWLLFSHYDFDFISEALLQEQRSENSGVLFRDGKAYFCMGVMEYDCVIIPGCVTLRNNTVRCLKDFQKAGGKVLLMGGTPEYVDAYFDRDIHTVTDSFVQIPFDRAYLLRELQEFREIDIRTRDGGDTDNILYRMRKIKDGRFLFLARANGRKNESFTNMVNSGDYYYVEELKIRVKGYCRVTEYDTLTGEKRSIACEYREGDTFFRYGLSIHGSLLLKLEDILAGTEESVDEMTGTIPAAGKEQAIREEHTLRDKHGLRLEVPSLVTFEEPNVLLLDRAEFRLDDGAWQPEEDILRIDNILRKKLSYPLKEEAAAQPWTDKSPDIRTARLYLKFTVETDGIYETKLALESAAETCIRVNGEVVADKNTEDWYVDEAIETIRIPALKKGINEIVLEIPYGAKANVEPCYLLGNFGVLVAGSKKKLTAPPDNIYFGDITVQGYPFYSGNFTYLTSFCTDRAGEVHIKAQYFNNPLLKVRIDGREAGRIAFAPYELCLGKLKEGMHILEITVLGNRFNTFGQLHNCDPDYSWFGSCSWRTRGDRWSEEYQLKKNGVLCTPLLYRTEE